MNTTTKIAKWTGFVLIFSCLMLNIWAQDSNPHAVRGWGCATVASFLLAIGI